jgi:hypothetical protein
MCLRHRQLLHGPAAGVQLLMLASHVLVLCPTSRLSHAPAAADHLHTVAVNGKVIMLQLVAFAPSLGQWLIKPGHLD